MFAASVSMFEATTGLPDLVGFALAFVFGSVVGSFLNVVIHRIPRGESIVFPNSACPKCDAKIRAVDNIPILSWLVLAGRCRACGEPISLRYPLVEALNGTLWVLAFWQVGFVPLLPVVLFFISSILALMFIDAEHMLLPNAITYPLIGIAFLARLLFPFFLAGSVFSDTGYAPLAGFEGQPVWLISLAGGALGAAAGGGSLWLVGELWKRLRGVDAMGLGDVKMMLGVGALLGWRLSLLSIFIAAFAGSLVGLVLISRQKRPDIQTQIPFGIFLGIGSIAAMLFGERMISWYASTFLP